MALTPRPGSSAREASPAGEFDVSIDIDELDLTGVPPARRFQVAASFERALVRLVAQDPPRELLDAVGGQGPGPPREVLDRRATLTVDPAANPVIVGEALARSVHGALR